MTIKDCPAIMRQQAEENKKDQYIAVTRCMLEPDISAMTDKERKRYANVLKDVLEVMDFQIYELYRELGDRYAAVLNLLWASSRTSDEELAPLVRFGSERHLVCADWFVRDTVLPTDLSGLDELPLKLLLATSRSATIEICGAGKYHTDFAYRLLVNGREAPSDQTVIVSVYDLLPDHPYEIVVMREDRKAAGCITIRTKHEKCTLNVKDFGAKGDGVSDDTHCLQGAILSCPDQGRVLIPAGTYRFKSLFLKSHQFLELAEGAELLAIPEREGLCRFPGNLPASDRRDGLNGEEYLLGTWEGNPLPMFSALICGIGVTDVYLYGRGTINGAAAKDNWWKDPKQMNMAYRPRLFFIKDCSFVYLQGLQLMNSPSWTIHPFFSKDLGFYNLRVENPFDSPNTDGLDPESCRGVEVAGVAFSLGDDCIAVKSGKIYVGRTYKTPSESIRIHHCLMENGHGAVTIGSEMAGGVKNLTVEDCDFSHTDRGLRIKTRRGRGRDAVLDRIIFRNIHMDHVMTPFVVNAFYYCDPDGKTDYVQSRETFPVDERTPLIRRLEFEDIEAENCHVAAAYVEGLPEAKIEEVIFRHIRVTYADQPKCDVPAMSSGVEAVSRRGIFIRNVRRLSCDQVSVVGCEGPAWDVDGVEEKLITEKE